MHYTELANLIAQEYGVPGDWVKGQVRSVLRWHGWSVELEDDRVDFIRESVAKWGDDLEGLDRTSSEDSPQACAQ